MFWVGFLDRVNDASQRFLREPKRHLGFQDAAAAACKGIVPAFTAPRPIGFASAFAGDHEHGFLTARLCIQETPDQQIMGLGLAEPVKIDLAVHLNAAAPDSLS